MQLTESQAWQKIGEAFDLYAHTGERPKRDAFGPWGNEPVGYFGLCHAVQETVGSDLSGQMLAKVWTELHGGWHELEQENGQTSAYLASYNPEGAATRAALAYLFAQETA
jgi:hypothetical protein